MAGRWSSPGAGRIALSRFCYRRKTLARQGPRKLPKLDVAGSTPVARSREVEELAPYRYEPRVGGGSLVALGSRSWCASRLPGVAGASHAAPAWTSRRGPRLHSYL